MDRRIIQIICGEGWGKTSAAIGKCISAVSRGEKVVFISFLKGKELKDYTCIKKLEPDMKMFCFEKETSYYDELSDEEKKEEMQNILNGFHFAGKVVETGECDLLVLDEVLGLLDHGIITIQDIYRLIEHCDDQISLLMTGKYVPKELLQHVDMVSRIDQVK